MGIIREFANRFLVAREYSFLKESQWYSPELLIELQNKKLSKLLIHAATNVPYYSALSDQLQQISNSKHPISYIADLPIVTRDILRQQGNEFKAKNYKSTSRQLIKTGGTTGQPLTLYIDNRLKVLNHAIERRGDYEWAMIPPRSKKAIIWGQPPKRSYNLTGWMKKLKENVQGSIHRRWRFYISRITDEELADQALRIAALKPDMLLGYASMLTRLATYMTEHQEVEIQPRVVLSTAETLSLDRKELMQKAFGCRIANRYSMAEFGTVASECPAGCLHSHAERVIVEVVRNGESVADGQEGEFVITDLDNYAYPLIRYATGDIGAIHTEPCNCGRGLPVLRSIDGRIVDYISSSSLSVPLLGNHLIRCFTKDDKIAKRIRQVQVEQREVDKLEVTIVCKENCCLDLISEEKLKQFMVDEYFASTSMQISFCYADRVNTTAAGKTPFFINYISRS